MGRRAVGMRAMTSAERSERWRHRGGRRSGRKLDRGVGRPEARRLIGDAEPQDIEMKVRARLELERVTARFLALLGAEQRG